MMTRSTNMEHVWKVGDRVRALCGVGDYIRSGDVGTVAAIDCGGCLWCTWDNPVTPELDEFGWCIRADEVAPADAAIASLSAPQPPAEAPRCTCPSGDGSLRWPCPAHPPEAQPPPSAPVGVEAGDRDCLTTRARELLADEYRKRGIGTGLVNDAGTATNVAIAAIATALAAQPGGSDNDR